MLNSLFYAEKVKIMEPMLVALEYDTLPPPPKPLTLAPPPLPPFGP